MTIITNHNMKAKYILITLLGLISISCTEELVCEDMTDGVEMVFTADMEDDQMTKTVLQNDRMSIWWSPSDSIKIFYGDYSSGLFVSTNRSPVSKATFRGTIDAVTGTIDNENDQLSFWAVYPFSMAGNATNSQVDITLPTWQHAEHNTFARGMFPAVAKSENTNLSFYNVCGGIVFTVQGEDIKYVTITGNKDERIAGKSIVTINTGRPELSQTPTESSITLKAPEGKTFTPGVRYFISIFPTTFESGFTLTFFKAASKSEVTFTKPATIKRSRFLIVENADSDAGEYEYAIPEEAYKDMDALYHTFALKITGNYSFSVPLRVLFNFCGDDVVTAGDGADDVIDFHSLNKFWYDGTNSLIRSMYDRLYFLINETNKFIEKYESDLPEIIGPAQVMRAYAHMMLAIGWGTPPLVDHVLQESEFPYNCDRDPNLNMTHEQLLVWCAEECESASEILDERESPQDIQGAYRITKGFAQALAGKAYLFAGNYQKARELLGNVISSGKYALVPGSRFGENFHIEGDGNEEKLFEPNLEYYPEMPLWGDDGYIPISPWLEIYSLCWRTDRFIQSPHHGYTGFTGGTVGWGHLGVPMDFAKEFYSHDGDSYRFKASLIHIDDIIGGEMYLADSGLNEMTKEQKLASYDVGITASGLYGQSFWLPFKQLVKESDTINSALGTRFNNFTIMRYAEVLLLYAEACIGSVDQAKGLAALNAVQVRSGSGKVSAILVHEAVKEEKKYELWFEGCRWPDLVRWGDTEAVKKAGQVQLTLYDKFFREPQVGDKNVVWENDTEAGSRFYTTAESLEGVYPHIGYVEGKHNRFPYPVSALEQNPNLVQNPGW